MLLDIRVPKKKKGGNKLRRSTQYKAEGEPSAKPPLVKSRFREPMLLPPPIGGPWRVKKPSR